MQRQRHGQRLLWSCVLGLSSVGLGALLPANLPGGVSIAQAEEFTEWQYNPDTQQLEVVLPENSTPRFFLLAQPARIVLDLPNTDVGNLVSEQNYSGVVRRVRVAQFEPGVTRIVLELTPDTVLAPGQAELTEVETLPGGATRWTLRPLLAGDTVADDTVGENLAATPIEQEQAPEIVEPPAEAAVPAEQEPAMVEPSPEEVAAPIEQEPEIVEPPTEAAAAPVEEEPAVVESLPEEATAPIEQEPEIVEPQAEAPVEPVEEAPAVVESPTDAPVDNVAEADLPEEAPAAEAAEPLAEEAEEAAIAPQAPAPDPIPTLETPTEPTTPAEVLPSEPASVEQPDPFAAEALPNDEPVASPPITPDAADPEVVPEPTTEPAPLGTEESPLVSEGADFLQTEPASLPLIQSSVGGGDMDEADEEAIALDSSVAIDPDEEENAIDIPVDFPEPTELPDIEEEENPESTVFPPTSEEPTEAESVTVPPLDDAEPSPEPEEIAAAPADPLLLIPSGTTLQLRYPGSTPIALEDDQVWQEVLVLAEPIQDEQGNVLLPAGSEILGRFEASRRGSRFIAQAIAIDEQIILFEAESDRVRGDNESPRTIAPNQIIELDVEEDVRRTAVGG
ncbi:AMIN domain-containing protein [Vacuolonema iberomarrocanum]|uniref:AMIN domain-containing protein n=1 Tax=Vacuolonema iberomarrocanum TaxID=3454632 RepID=UPI0019D9FED6|nr:AMIN domain-containing protein [filamentous cyanobacterium LEGE 07170]